MILKRVSASEEGSMSSASNPWRLVVARTSRKTRREPMDMVLRFGLDYLTSGVSIHSLKLDSKD